MYLAFVLGAPWPALCLASIQLTMFHCAHHSQTDPLDDPFEDAELEALALSDLAVHCGITSSSLSLAVKPSPTTTANILHVLASVTVNGFGCSNK
ncbi:hypothetical protein Pmani_005342 [Petrolisthes manimaculis]|uniref:Secreted protein n=1 Tax=Petrolisthes manimaculis TaxID=1843537 RepID=A0AAE1PMY6_9EUCA|nr:hypothetical protein Pmani_018180 [Petrolisthes manimaculis]KAK4311434.1 hypothetical protein Pmani_017054 [Petrolisthes manimaculis]KAK4323995.1 hypothetical protein Pmani_005342 [Petrolisthes manimaculis]